MRSEEYEEFIQYADRAIKESCTFPVLLLARILKVLVSIDSKINEQKEGIE